VSGRESEGNAGAAPLRPGLFLAADGDGTRVLVDPRNAARHEVPAPLRARIEAALGPGAPADAEVAAFLDARHLVASPRVLAVEAWARGQAGEEPRGAAGEIAIVPGARFSCHGCGTCCRIYSVVPVGDAERDRILAGTRALAPHVAAPPEAWFSERSDQAADGLRWRIAHRASGDCIFLDPRGLCLVHAHLGLEAKPLTCRLFPLRIARRPDGTVATLRLECDSLARSRDDGEPLERQRAWIDAVARDSATQAVPAIVRVGDETHVPFAFARRIEAEALALLAAAPTADAALAAIRDVVLGVARLLPAAPRPEDLDRAEALLLAPPARRRAPLGPALPERVVGALAFVLGLMLDSLPVFFARQPPTLAAESAPRAEDRLMADILRTLYAACRRRVPGPEHAEVPAAAEAEAARAAAVDAAAADPEVLDFVRACYVQAVGSGRPLGARSGLVLGFADLAFLHVLARWGARLLAARRGAARASREDWNRAIATVDRAVRPFGLRAAELLLFRVFAEIDATL
jgi:Fe-S-cluster containining protein